MSSDAQRDTLEGLGLDILFSDGDALIASLFVLPTFAASFALILAR